MENNQIKPNNGLGLGIAGLILGIVAVIAAMFKCTSMLGLVLGILGVALSTIGYSQAKKVDAEQNLILAALVVCIIGTGLAMYNLTSSMVKLGTVSWEKVGKDLERKIEEDTEDFGKAFEEEFEKELGGSLEEVLQDLEEDLEDLEDEFDSLEDSFDSLTDEEKARRLGRAAGRALRGFVDELADSTEINITIETD